MESINFKWIDMSYRKYYYKSNTERLRKEMEYDEDFENIYKWKIDDVINSSMNQQREQEEKDGR